MGVHLSKTSHVYHWQSLNELRFRQDMHELVLLAVRLLGTEEAMVEAVLLLLIALATHWVVKGTSQVINHLILSQGCRAAFSDFKELLFFVSGRCSLLIS